MGKESTNASKISQSTTNQPIWFLSMPQFSTTLSPKFPTVSTFPALFCSMPQPNRQQPNRQQPTNQQSPKTHPHPSTQEQSQSQNQEQLLKNEDHYNNTKNDLILIMTPEKQDKTFITNHYNKKNKFETDSNSVTSTTKTENKKLRNKTRRSKRKKKGETDIKMMYSNIRGYRSKRTSLIQILEEVKPDIVLLIETNLTGNTTINVPGYKAVCRNRKNSDGGGLAILVNNSIKQNILMCMDKTWQRYCPTNIYCIILW